MNKKISVSGPMVQKQAPIYAEEMGLNNFRGLSLISIAHCLFVAIFSGGRAEVLSVRQSLRPSVMIESKSGQMKNFFCV